MCAVASALALGGAASEYGSITSGGRRPPRGATAAGRVLMLPCMKPAGRVKSPPDPSLWM